MHEEFGRKYYYYPSRKTVQLLYPNSHLLSGFKFKSPCIKHDLELTKVIKVFKGSKVIFDLYTENELLVSSNQWLIDNLFSCPRSIRPDALFTTKSNGEAFYNAIELEMTQKGSQCYVSKVKRYYQNKKIRHVFFVSRNTTILSKVRDIENQLYPTGYTKFYYALLSDLVSQKLPFNFQDCRGNLIKFI